MDRIERTLRGFYKYRELTGLGKIYTPKELRERMLKIAKPEKTDKILILYNIEFASDLRDYDNVVFASDDLDKNELVENVFGMKTVFIEDNKKISKKFEGMKFDLIISNPPYNHNLDLKILKDVYELGEKICFVHPTTWLYDKKLKNKLYLNVRDLIRSSLEKVIEFNIQDFFKAWTFSTLGIVLINKHCEVSIDPYSFDKHGNSDIYKSIKNKILLYCNHKNNYQKMLINSNERYTFYFGNNLFSPYRVLVQKRILENHISNIKKYPLNLGFDNKETAYNFYEYAKTKIARFCLSIFQITQAIQNGELEAVPYMPTYTRPWTDEDVAKELGLTDEELAWAINWIPDYYPEDKEKYAKYKK